MDILSFTRALKIIVSLKNILFARLIQGFCSFNIINNVKCQYNRVRSSLLRREGRQGDKESEYIKFVECTDVEARRGNHIHFPPRYSRFQYCTVSTHTFLTLSSPDVTPVSVNDFDYPYFHLLTSVLLGAEQPTVKMNTTLRAFTRNIQPRKVADRQKLTVYISVCV